MGRFEDCGNPLHPARAMVSMPARGRFGSGRRGACVNWLGREVLVGSAFMAVDAENCPEREEPEPRTGVRLLRQQQWQRLDQPMDCMISRIRAAVSDGVLPTLTPAASRASFFACAVPAEPETMAPAWPMVLPSGAVKPAT